MNNDPLLALLLKGVTDPAQREAIIEAHATLNAGGAKSLPGALSIYHARLIQVVLEHTEKTIPSAAHDGILADLLKAIKQVHEMDIPQVVQAKEEFMVANLSTRRLRISYVLLWLLLVALVAAGAGGYGVYRVCALTPEQQNWLAIGKHQGRALTQDEIIFLKIGNEMHRHNTDVITADSAPGIYSIKVVGKQPILQPTYIGEGGQATGIQIFWKDDGAGQ
jgi:hypothetical protein